MKDKRIKTGVDIVVDEATGNYMYDIEFKLELEEDEEDE